MQRTLSERAHVMQGARARASAPCGKATHRKAKGEPLLAAPGPGLPVHAIATGAVADEFWISVRGPLKHQADALQRLEAQMKELDGVTVDLGTIALSSTKRARCSPATAGCATAVKKIAKHGP
jgi:hypothetical protein